MFEVGDRVFYSYPNGDCYGFKGEDTVGTVMRATEYWIVVKFDNPELNSRQDYNAGWRADSFELYQEIEPVLDVWE